ncbi:adenine phosphoribosyltransferase [soil metagenome]
MTTSPSMGVEHALDHHVRSIPDWPEPGVTFRDLTPLMGHPQAFGAVVDELVRRARQLDGPIDMVIGLEARGFIFGPPVALALGAGFVPIRKAGKLPSATHDVTYELEYGNATVQIHQDAIEIGQRVLVVDDVLATGGTLAAANQLVTACGGTIVANFVVLEIDVLQGRDTLAGIIVEALRHI